MTVISKYTCMHVQKCMKNVLAKREWVMYIKQAVWED